MSIKKWTDEELTSTLEKLDAWRVQYKGTGWGPRLWLLTALLGAFAISTGVAFMFLDGVDAVSLLLILMGSITCFSWFQSEKRKKVNITFIEDINKELKRRERQRKKAEKSVNKKVARKQGENKKQSVEKTADKEEAEDVKSDEDGSDKKETDTDVSDKK